MWLFALSHANSTKTKIVVLLLLLVVVVLVVVLVAEAVVVVVVVVAMQEPCSRVNVLRPIANSYCPRHVICTRFSV